MPSALQNFKAAVQAVWEAEIPENDGSLDAYAFIDSLAEDQDNGQHRQLIWRVARQNETLLELSEDTRWELACELFIHRDPIDQPRDYAAHAAAAENEANALRIAFNNIPGQSLGTDVNDAVLVRTRFFESLPTRRPPASGGVNRSRVIRVEFTFQVDCQEA